MKFGYWQDSEYSYFKFYSDFYWYCKEMGKHNC